MTSDDNQSLVKLAIVWVGTFAGHVSLSQIVMTLTIIYTLLQIYRTVRELWFKR
jgi:hypothetical protein